MAASRRLLPANSSTLEAFCRKPPGQGFGSRPVGHRANLHAKKIAAGSTAAVHGHAEALAPDICRQPISVGALREAAELHDPVPAPGPGWCCGDGFRGLLAEIAHRLACGLCFGFGLRFGG